GAPTPAYWILAPFVIDDEGFGNYTWSEVVNEPWCTGSGTLSDPYIIQDLIIDCEGFSSGITIENSDVYFRIENCSISNSGYEFMDSGIKLINVSNGVLAENNLSRNEGMGIGIDICLDINITNNIVYNNAYGIVLVKSNYSRISDNEVGGSLYYGIVLVEGGPPPGYVFGVKSALLLDTIFQ
ncbi:unnamed protein product, partial [marine sediment metagenome]